MIGYAILTLGIVNLGLIWFQLMSGRQWIKVPMTVHKKTGIVLVVCGTLHAALALLLKIV